MATQSQFVDFLRDIEPSQTTKENCAAAHGALRDYVAVSSSFKDRHVHTYLSGSYKRDTSIRPSVEDGVEKRPDVDIIVITNHLLADNPKEVIDELYWALKSQYANITRQSRSVGISQSRVDMDVVPIIEPDESTGLLYVPDRSEEKWVRTNPPGHTEWTTATNKKAGGRFKPLVKLIKWWRRANPTISHKPKGFVLECMIEQCMAYEDVPYEELFLRTLEGIVTRYQVEATNGGVPSIDDPSVPGNKVTSAMSADAFKGLYSKAKEHAELGRSAQTEANAEKQLKKWRNIFGDRFPATVSGNRAGLLSAPASVGGGFTFPDTPVRPNKPGGFA